MKKIKLMRKRATKMLKDAEEMELKELKRHDVKVQEIKSK